ncbi:MAG: cell surface glycoprotein [Halalkalicoccus sp.]
MAGGWVDPRKRDEHATRRERRAGLRRRSVLALCGAALSSAAGCTDTGDEEAPDEERTDGPIAVREATVSETHLTTEETLEVTGTIENEGEREGTFHAQLRVDDVIVDTQAVPVESKKRESVTFEGSFGDPGEYEVAVNDVHAGTVRVERPPPAFELVETELNQTTVTVGEGIDVRATLANDGGREGRIELELRADGRAAALEEVPIEAGAEREVAFTEAFDVPGSYELTVRAGEADPPESRVSFGETVVGTVVVERPAAFEIVETALSERAVDVGEEIEVHARIENVGGQAGTIAATLEADGEALATREGEIEAGETATARFAVSFDRRGRRSLAVNDARVGTVYVRECTREVDGTIAVDSRSVERYPFDLREHDELRVDVRREAGVEPTLAVVGPDGPIEDESGETIRRTIGIPTPGRYEVRLENEALLPWNDGTWAVEVTVCRW